MKLYYSKILLFLLPLNILVTSLSNVYNENKPHITPHHTQTNRSLCECDIQSSIYNKDEEMKSVKEIFDRQTSQRFEEYEERMKVKRKKCKEERDKNIQKIIEKDKREKSLAEKIEKGCLGCGCGLGGVAASVGIFGTVAVKELTKTATAVAMVEGEAAARAAGAIAGAEAGKKFVIEELQKLYVSTLGDKTLVSYFSTTDYTKASLISSAIIEQYKPSQCAFTSSGGGKTFCNWVNAKSVATANVQRMTPVGVVSDTDLVKTHVSALVEKATAHAAQVTNKTTEDAIKASTAAVEAKYASCQTAIIASVVAILVIVLVMIIIYLVLRYRRKMKMNKKAQYTKLLNQ
ncbi:rifin PIR protein, putative [Plasmodium reichenowi]|uniref:Rifin PIR protein, putative n=1 Tax=Plasmodium reichenowi TaxID=5854 RepID=A0A2P9DHE4_PLARE|nr:rifin PIR protein, putative [Plasmodium reichenowi]